MQPLNVCFVSSEVVPYAKTGGLADVSGALAKYLSRSGYDIRVFMPLYSSIDFSTDNVRPVDFLQGIPIQLGNDTVIISVYTTQIPDSTAPVYFIDCPRFYHRGKIYTDDSDEYIRFALLSYAAIECCQRMGWGPDIFHCNDWQTALIPLLLTTVYAWDDLFVDSRTVLTIHNLAYQGVFAAEAVDHIGLTEYRSRFHQEEIHSGVVNYMKTGIMYADVITTVSETYAREIQTPEYGCGLEDILHKRSDTLVGIVNGVDYNEWSPELDMYIPFNYSMGDLDGKEESKKNLLERLELPYDPAAPVLGIVSRLTGQKGFELLFDILEPLVIHNNIRVAILGSGEEKYEQFFEGIHHHYRHKVCFYRGFQPELSHLIEAGSDIFLMPSRYEPCGLNQIYSLKYGTIPIVRKTGGLADTVQQYNPATGEGNGVVFEDFTSQGLAWGIEFALTMFKDKNHWRRMMANAMAMDYSWDVQVKKYKNLYSALVGHR